jgi:hypothetical protein
LNFFSMVAFAGLLSGRRMAQSACPSHLWLSPSGPAVLFLRISRLTARFAFLFLVLSYYHLASASQLLSGYASSIGFSVGQAYSEFRWKLPLLEKSKLWRPKI